MLQKCPQVSVNTTIISVAGVLVPARGNLSSVHKERLKKARFRGGKHSYGISSMHGMTRSIQRKIRLVNHQRLVVCLSLISDDVKIIIIQIYIGMIGSVGCCCASQSHQQPAVLHLQQESPSGG